MTLTARQRGTSEVHFRIGISGPTIYVGTTSPVSTPPTAIDTLKDGDAYLRTGTGTEGLWILESGTWYRTPSGGAGGTFNGTITVATGQTRVAAGAVGAPSFAFAADTDTGMTSLSTGTIDMVLDGASVLNFTSNLITHNINTAIPAIENYRTDVVANGTSIGQFNFKGKDSGNNLTTYARIEATAATVTDTTEAGRLDFRTINAGTLATVSSVDATGLYPGVDNTFSNGTVSRRWTTVYGNSTSAFYADLAERYDYVYRDQPLDYEELPVGAVVVICADRSQGEIEPCYSNADESVLGVISKDPAFKMNDRVDNQNWPYVALRGRVMVQVYGVVNPGDLLVTSEYRGHARRATWWERMFKSKAVFAKALHKYVEDDNTTEPFGLVEAVIL